MTWFSTTSNAVAVSARSVLTENLMLLRSTSMKAIASAAENQRLRKALRAAAVTREMRAAQRSVAHDRYLRPAIEACAGSGFDAPLSLAVIYDSITHGSFEMIRDRVRIDRARVPSASFENRWIMEYVKRRHEWLRSVPRLKATSYRTAFFLAQIIAGNWDLKLPVTVHGSLLSLNDLPPEVTGDSASAAGPRISADTSKGLPESLDRERENALPAKYRPPANFERLGDDLANIFARYDQLESILRTVVSRTDAAKSLWTTVAGTLWQTFWAIVAFVIGLPRELWLAVALIAAVLTLAYLYRQYALGRVRETYGLVALTSDARRQNGPWEKRYERS